MAELRTLARPYAKAAFEYAFAAGDLAGWASQLNLVAAVSQTDKVAKLLNTPSLTADQQAASFIAVCGDELNAKVQNFVKVLAKNKRIPLLPYIAALFDEFKSNQEKSVDVEVSTVYALSPEAQQKLAEKLARKLDRSVNITAVVDKDLIGGVLIRAADVVIDGSVRGRLAKLAEAMNS